jgi:hypothetical protein
MTLPISGLVRNTAGSVAHAFQPNVIMADFHKDGSVADWKRSRPSDGTHSPTLHRISLRDGDYTSL